MTKVTTQIRNKLNNFITPTIAEAVGITITNTMGAVYITEFIIPATTQAVAGAALGFGRALGTLPKGNLVVRSVSVDLETFMTTAGTDTPEVGIGTVIATGAISSLGAGSATFEDCGVGTSTTLLAGTTVKDTNFQINGEFDQKDGTSTAKTLYMNWADSWAATDTFNYSGKVTVEWYITHTV